MGLPTVMDLMLEQVQRHPVHTLCDATFYNPIVEYAACAASGDKPLQKPLSSVSSDACAARSAKGSGNCGGSLKAAAPSPPL
ncbi:MAG: hypothetical protein Q7J57_02490 [Gemmobacter sp.]|nr:hypothetical protein [Gemmobacter sp.]